MVKRVLIIGGYGNFGSFIARRLSQERGVRVVVAGRSKEKARALAESLDVEWAAIDIDHDLARSLEQIRPDIVIHTSGPYQRQGYHVAEACIRHKCHYIDLADAREFVTQIGRLGETAKSAGVLVVSGASSVPALTSAIVDKYRGEFETLDAISYGIATAQQTNRGLATTSAVLSYAGKPFKTPIDGRLKDVYGWQDLHFRKFQHLGWRALGNCDIPDLDLFPQRYPGLRTIRFYAGLEVAAVHIGLWLLTWLVRFGVIESLDGAAPVLLKLARRFDRFGTDNSGFYMELAGIDATGKPKKLVFNLTATFGDGPFIPCMPAIVLALALARDEIRQRGAFPCVGLVDFDTLIGSFKGLNIDWHLSGEA